MRGKRQDLAGIRFGNLDVTGTCKRSAGGGAMLWQCVCACGAIVWKRSDRLLQGKVRSCSAAHRWTGARSAA